MDFGALTGGTIALVKNGLKLTYGAAKGTYHKIKDWKDNKKKEEIDEEKYKTVTKLTDRQNMILTIVKQYMAERGVELEDEFSSKEDLINAVKKLNPDDKKTLNSVVKKMDSAISKFEDKKAEKAKSALNFLENAFLIAATTMTVTDFVKFLDDKINNPTEPIKDNTIIDTSDGKEPIENNTIITTGDESIKSNMIIDNNSSQNGTTDISIPKSTSGTRDFQVTEKMKESYKELLEELEER